MARLEFPPERSMTERVEQGLDILYRRKWIVITFLVISVAIVATLTFIQDPLYEARGYLLVNVAEPIPSRSGASAADLLRGNGDVFSTNERSLLEELVVLQVASPLVHNVAERLQQIQVTEAGTPISLLFLSSGEKLGMVQLVERLRETIKLAPEPGSNNIIRISAISKDSQEAALLVNLFGEEYISLTEKARSERLTETWAFLEEQEKKRREELRQIEDQIRTYVRTSGAVGLDQAVTNLIGQIAELQARRDEARVELQMRQRTLTDLENDLEKAQLQLVEHLASGADTRLQRMQDQIALLETKRAQITQRYPESQRTPTIQEELKLIDDQITVLHDETGRIVQQYVTEGFVPEGSANSQQYITTLRRRISDERSAIEGLNARIALLEERLNLAQLDLRNVPQQSMELAQLERSRAYAERMYQRITDLMLEHRLTSEPDQSKGYVRFIQKADVPTEPLSKNPIRNLILATFLGLSLGLGMAVVRDKFDNRIYKPDQLRQRGYNISGVIPDLRSFIKDQFNGETHVTINDRRVPTTLTALLDPMSPIVEMYRHLRTNIQFGLSGKPLRTLVVTSSNMEEGKSVTSANLAIVMAQAGRRTLLIDADLRRPQVHRMFDIKSAPGLVELISGDTSNLMERTKSRVENLYVLPAGNAATDSAELLGSTRFKSTLNALLNQFDTIILDTPPILAATDAALIATQCDATLLVVRAGHTREKELDASMEALSDVGATVIGVLLNGFNLSMAYGHKYQYQYFSKYGHHSDYGYKIDPGQKNGKILRRAAV